MGAVANEVFWKKPDLERQAVDGEQTGTCEDRTGCLHRGKEASKVEPEGAGRLDRQFRSLCGQISAPRRVVTGRRAKSLALGVMAGGQAGPKERQRRQRPTARPLPSRKTLKSITHSEGKRACPDPTGCAHLHQGTAISTSQVSPSVIVRPPWAPPDSEPRSCHDGLTTSSEGHPALTGGLLTYCAQCPPHVSEFHPRLTLPQETRIITTWSP